MNSEVQFQARTIYAETAKPKEVARRLNLSIETVRSWVRRNDWRSSKSLRGRKPTE